MRRLSQEAVAAALSWWRSNKYLPVGGGCRHTTLPTVPYLPTRVLSTARETEDRDGTSPSFASGVISRLGSPPMSIDGRDGSVRTGTVGTGACYCKFHLVKLSKARRHGR
ncbi:hypothetical protein PMIN06_006247 [Paraphaeosphaeria minitans]